jgi:hypothetical protein
MKRVFTLAALLLLPLSPLAAADGTNVRNDWCPCPFVVEPPFFRVKDFS